MGGQSISKDGIIIDMQYMNKIKYNEKEQTVKVGTGALWADLIKFLNNYGKSPRTLQSYCSFSVGGTLSVNGHGITTDFTVSESVVCFTLVKSDGNVITCSRNSENEEEKELFSLALGGYGLVGIIADVTLKVENNYPLFLDHCTVSMEDFPDIYESILQNDDIQMKLARIDTTTFKTVDIFVFTKDSETISVSKLPEKPKEMGKVSGMIYKWIAAPLREVRFAIERNLGIALDWSNVSDKNEMLFESAAPLARLYSPLVMLDDTFILQEYFIPKDYFDKFINNAKLIVDKINLEQLITLLNITIRFVHKDNDTFLSYANSDHGVYAFVLYYRIRRSLEADELLSEYHKQLSDIAIKSKGTFYLPYRHHYTDEQLIKAYPNFNEFIQKKQKYDPENKFNNLWFTRYSKRYFDNNNVIIKKVDQTFSKDHDDEEKSCVNNNNNEFYLPDVSLHRDDSFVKLAKNSRLRNEFKDLFLTEIFSISNNTTVWKSINSAIWRQKYGCDNDIYDCLLKIFHENNSGISLITQLWKQISQLSFQKKELVREIISILARLGEIGNIHSYCSIGDHGKLILPLKKALRMKGKSFIIHDSICDDNDIPSILERGELSNSKTNNSEFIKIKYERIKSDDCDKIPNSSCDLVTMNQGLHHLPLRCIQSFLSIIYRILKPGGLFIVREHDLDENLTLLPMLDCAHMVFNAGTNVSLENEKNEIRGFRSVLEWRKIIESAGFEDTLVYEMQPNDPTIDIMMCFRKLPKSDDSSAQNDSIHGEDDEDIRSSSSIMTQKLETHLKDSNPGLLRFLDNAPEFVLNIGIQLLTHLIEQLPIVNKDINKLLEDLLNTLGYAGFLPPLTSTIDNVSFY